MCLEVPSAARNNTNKSSLRNVETILSAYRQHQFNSNSSVHTLPGHGQGSCPISIFLLVDPATQACTYFYNVVMLSSPAIRQFRETRHTILRHMKPCSLRNFEFRGCCVDEKDRSELYGSLLRRVRQLRVQSPASSVASQNQAKSIVSLLDRHKMSPSSLSLEDSVHCSLGQIQD